MMTSANNIDSGIMLDFKHEFDVEDIGFVFFE